MTAGSGASTVLVTGGSGGIGREFARLFAREGSNLILVARNGGSLDSLARELRDTHGVDVRVLVRDLSEEPVLESLADELSGVRVDILVNNAGFGAWGKFSGIEWETEHRMIVVNITALTRLVHLFLPGMLERGYGKILNVASTAAFQPGPLMAVYYATKAYVLHLTEALAEEYRGSGVTFTALCPGPTASGFDAAAGISGSRRLRGPFLASSGSVAAYGYRALMEGRTVAVEGVLNRILANAPRFLPRGAMVRIMRKIQENKSR